MRFQFELTGAMPFLMHADDVEASDELKAWRKNAKNKSVSVAGDDRSPPWTWTTYLYSDGEHLALPQECVMATLRFAGARISGEGRTTFKALSQSGLAIATEFCEFTTGGKSIPVEAIYKFKDATFATHVAKAKALGFRLFVKRAAVGQAKHVRVRARFDTWTVRGELDVLEPAITPDVLLEMFEIAGRLSGLGDWRPSSKKSPGPFGKFTAKLKQLK